MKRSADMIVIGGGMAGVAAALAGAGRGAHVVLVRRAPGATALIAGGWHGPLPDSLASHFEAVGHPWPAIDQPLPAPDGSLRRFERAAPAQSACRLEAGTMVCGIAGLSGFHAAVLSRMWGEAGNADLTCDSIRVEQTPPSGWSPAALAAHIARDPQALARTLRDAVQRNSARAVILPAVLGHTEDTEDTEGHRDASDSVRATIESLVGVPVGESLGAAPSIPGWRLMNVLERMLKRAGIEVVTGRVLHAQSLDRQVQSIAVQTASEAVQLQAAAFVLATGKYIGGGIEADTKLCEPALNCPVWIEHAGETFESAEPLALTNADRREDQPLLAAGLAVDAEGRPIDHAGSVVFNNVWAAGAVRRGYDGALHGLGHVAAEGWAAGERGTAGGA